MNRSESKFNNTAKKMHNALIKLLEKKSFKDISIVEICKAAGVNRSTFYDHYTNTHDLIKETHTNLIEEFFNSFTNSFEDVHTLAPRDLIFISPKYLIPFLQFVKQNKLIFKVYMNNLQTFESNKIYILLMEKVFLPIYKKNGITDKVAIDYIINFYLQGIFAIVMKWLNNNCLEDENYIVQIITTCIKP